MGKDADCCDTCRELGHSTETAPPVAETPLVGKTVTLLVHSLRTEQAFVVDGDVTIGRATTNALPIQDVALSRRQCILRITDDRVTIEDLGSTCGTYLDGRQTRGPTEVGSGSVISMGSTRIRVLRT